MPRLKTAGLFAGIGGLELGLGKAGHSTEMLCEIACPAISVLRDRFPDTRLEHDVRKLRDLPKVDLITAGFPCQDLSQAGHTAGITGKNSSLVSEVFRLLRRHEVPHVLLENVSFMLHLHAGQAIRLVIDRLEKLGYSWAYRILDSRAFGLPQRRERIFLLASKTIKPWQVLLQDDMGPDIADNYKGKACGFYWTEGIRGLGWAIDAVPTLKGGSTIGIPSSPAIWLPDGRIVTPDIRDAERLQGFPADWTKAAEKEFRRGIRWKLVGNAVSVPVAEWIGKRLVETRTEKTFAVKELESLDRWPHAAFGSRDGRYAISMSSWPTRKRTAPLAQFLKYGPKELSFKGIDGFLKRLTASSLRYPTDFLVALQRHRDKMALLTPKRETA